MINENNQSENSIEKAIPETKDNHLQENTVDKLFNEISSIKEQLTNIKIEHVTPLEKSNNIITEVPKFKLG